MKKIKINTWLAGDGGIHHSVDGSDFNKVGEEMGHKLTLIRTEEIEVQEEPRRLFARKIWAQDSSRTPGVFYAWSDPNHEGVTEFTEVLPGQRLISREDLWKAWPYLPQDDPRDRVLNILLRNLGFDESEVSK